MHMKVVIVTKGGSMELEPEEFERTEVEMGGLTVEYSDGETRHYSEGFIAKVYQ